MAEVRDNAAAHRFEIVVDGNVAGRAEYVEEGDKLVFTHTEIDDAYEGQGLGGQLARGALDAVRASGRPAVSRCEFISGWVDKHPDYADVLQ
jgi:predicted GNAT family acetyltransferase